MIQKPPESKSPAIYEETDQVPVCYRRWNKFL